MPIQIRAESIEEFKKMENNIKKLPDLVSERIKSAELRGDGRIEYGLCAGYEGVKHKYYFPANPESFTIINGNLTVEYKNYIFIYHTTQKDSSYSISFI